MRRGDEHPVRGGKYTLSSGDGRPGHSVQGGHAHSAQGKYATCGGDRHPVLRDVRPVPRGHAPCAESKCIQRRAGMHPVRRGRAPRAPRAADTLPAGCSSSLPGAGSRRPAAAEHFHKDLLPPACSVPAPPRSTGARPAPLSRPVPGSPPRVTGPAGRLLPPGRSGGHQRLSPGTTGPSSSRWKAAPGAWAGSGRAGVAGAPIPRRHPWHQDIHPAKIPIASTHPSRRDVCPSRAPIPAGYPSHQGTHPARTPIPPRHPSHQDAHPTTAPISEGHPSIPSVHPSTRASCQGPAHPSKWLPQTLQCHKRSPLANFWDEIPWSV